MGQTQPDAPPPTPTTDDRIRFSRPDERRLRTIIGVVIDESGSMGDAGKREAAISAFNNFVDEQARESADDCGLTLWKFNTNAWQVHGVLPIGHVPHLTAQTYSPAGGTAIYDAVAHLIGELDQETADRIVVVVLTDGENNSGETTAAQLAALTAAREATGMWSFVYLSSSPQAWATAATLGYQVGNTVQMANTGAAYMATMATASRSLRAFRQTGMTRSATMMTPDAAPTPIDVTAVDTVTSALDPSEP